MSAPRPPWRCWVACTTRWPASDAHQLATATASVAGRPSSRRHAACHVRDPDGLGVDVGVGRAGSMVALERRQGHAELHALVEVRRGAVARPPRRRRAGWRTARCGPGRASTPPRAAPSLGAGQHLGGARRAPRRGAGGGGPGDRWSSPARWCARAGGIDQGHDGAPSRRRRRAAGTSTRAARCAWGTAQAVPCRRQPSPSALGRAPTVDRLARPATSFTAADRRTSPGHRPAATRPVARRCRSAATARAPSTSVTHSGTGATARPCCSRTRHISVRPRPEPPWSSGDGQAEQIGPGELAPQRLVEAVVGRAPPPPPARRSPCPAKIDGGRLGHRLLLLGEGEVHQLPRRTADGATAGREHRERQLVVDGHHLDHDGHADLDVRGIDADQIGHEPRPLLELHHARSGSG